MSLTGFLKFELFSLHTKKKSIDNFYTYLLFEKILLFTN